MANYVVIHQVGKKDIEYQYGFKKKNFLKGCGFIDDKNELKWEDNSNTIRSVLNMAERKWDKNPLCEDRDVVYNARDHFDGKLGKVYDYEGKKIKPLYYMCKTNLNNVASELNNIKNPSKDDAVKFSIKNTICFKIGKQSNIKEYFGVDTLESFVSTDEKKDYMKMKLEGVGVFAAALGIPLLGALSNKAIWGW
jgi:hypothetical protein